MSINLPGCPPDSADCPSNSDIAAVNSILLGTAEQFGPMMQEDYTPEVSPYANMFDRTQWPDGQARFNSFQWEANAPDAALEGRWESVKTSDGVFNACNYALDVIPYGYTRREGCQYRTGFRTPWLCLEDLRYKHDRVAQVAGLLRIMSGWFSTIQHNFIGLMFKKSVDNWIPTDASANGRAQYAIKRGEFEFGAVPVSTLTPNMLRRFYMEKQYANAHRARVGAPAGVPMHAMVIGEELYRHCIESDPNFKDAILEFEPERITNGLQVKSSIEGFTPLFTQYPYRFDWNRVSGELELVQPLIHENVTSGIKSEVNPAWEAAPLEWVAFPTRDTMSLADPNTGTSMGQANFDASVFRATPNVVWHNQKDNDCNVFGNQGFFYTLIQMGCIPKYPDHGAGVLVRRPNIEDVITCGDFVAYDATDAITGGDTVYRVSSATQALADGEIIIELDAQISPAITPGTTKIELRYHSGETAVVTVEEESAGAPWRYRVSFDAAEPCACSNIKTAAAYTAPAGGFDIADVVAADEAVDCACVEPDCPPAT